METVLRTLKVRLIADTSDYSAAMASAQAKALALKGQLQSVFAAPGGVAPASGAGMQMKRIASEAAARARVSYVGTGGALPPPTMGSAGGMGNLPTVWRSASDLPRAMRDATTEARAFGQSLNDGLTTALAKARALGPSLGKFGDGARQFGDRMVQGGTQATTRLTLPVGIAGGMMLGSAGDFEAAMKSVGVLAEDAGASTDLIAGLEARARELGASTQFSATQVADAMYQMIQAGVSAEDTMTGVSAALDLAGASGMGIAESANLVGKVMGSQQMSAEDLTHAVNVLTKASLDSMTNLQSLGEAFKVAGPIAHIAGMEFEDTASALATMSEAGFEGSTGGNALKRSLIELAAMQAPGMEGGTPGYKRMEALGVAAKTATGELRPLVDILEDLNAANANLDDFNVIFGNFGAGPMADLSTRTVQMRERSAMLREVGDVAAKVNAAKMSGFKGQLEQLSGAFDELGIAIGESGVLKFATDMASNISGLLSSMSKADPALLSFTTTALTLVAAIGPGMAVAGTLIWSMGRLASVAKPLAGLFAGPGGLALAAGGLVWALTSLTEESQNVNGSLREGKEALDKVKVAQAAITSDSALLEAAYQRQTEAMQAQDQAATDAAESEVAALTRRISKNQELVGVYKAIASAKLAEAQQRDKEADRQDRRRLMTIAPKLANDLPLDGIADKPDYLWWKGARLVNEGNLDRVIAAIRAEIEIAQKAGEALSAEQTEFLKIMGEGAQRDLDVAGFQEQVAALDDITAKVATTTQGIATSWKGATEETTGYAKLMASEVADSMTTGMDPAITGAQTAAKAISEAFKQTYIDVVGNSYVPDMVDGIGAEMARLDEVAVAPAAAAASKVSGIFEGLSEGVAASMDSIGGSISRGLSGSLRSLVMGGDAPNSANLIRGILQDQKSQIGRGASNYIFGTLGDSFKGWSGATKGDRGWQENTGGNLWQSALSWIGDLFGGGSGMPSSGRRAAGGSVFPGRIYEVGEFGPEKFIPRTAGYIANDNQWDAMTRGGRGGGQTIDARTIINGNVDSVSWPAVKAAIDANNRMWAARFPAAVNATLMDNSRQKRRF